MARTPRNEILLGDALDQLRTLADASVDCVVTSPPYYLLRTYGHRRQLGLEDTVDAYVARLVSICDELARVLKPTGTLWFNLGDSYSRHDRYGAPPKSLLMAPERVAAALIERGWVLRSKVVWSKPNPMPSSVRDRLTCSWEYLFVFARQRDYFFDLDAIRQPHRSHRGTGRGLTRAGGRATAETGQLKYATPHGEWAGPLAGKNDGLARARAEGRAGHSLGKNPADVWTLATGNYRGAHFATFPERLVERPLRAGCPARVCATCGRAWTQQALTPTAPACGCGHRRWRPGLVLDPFIGSGTTAVAAARLGRDWLGIELNPAYRRLALQRIATAVPESAATGGDARHQGASHAPHTDQRLDRAA
jgi:DNA modification methylase